MRQVAPLTVLARGHETRFAAVRRAEVAETLAEMRRRAETAHASGNAAEEAAALKQELEATRRSEAEWQALAEEEERRAARFESRANLAADYQQKVVALEQQVEYLFKALNASSAGSVQEEAVSSDPWAASPSLFTGDGESARRLFMHLVDASGGSIEFTPRAESSWKKCKYPNPEEMSQALVKLAKAAAALYDGTERSMPHLDNWLREEFSLKVALSDDTIEKSSSMRYFDFDGRRYDRTPHVKVADYTSPNSVGRIHFALDADHGRLVVDHVGLKLY